MIAKKYRLSEREIRKVFRQKKPFFSYMLIANVQKNSLWYNRFGILLSAKVTPGSVNRNAFRRIFYHASSHFLENGYDVVIVVKKWFKFSHKDEKIKQEFSENLSFLYQKIFSF